METDIKTRALSLLLKHNLEDNNFFPSRQEVVLWNNRNLPQKPVLEKNNYDLILIAAERDLGVTAKYIDYYINNLSPQKIVIITKKNQRTKELFQNKNVEILDENEICEGLSYKAIKDINGEIVGGYFHQFLKMAYAYRCRHEYYLIFDGDTVPLNPIPFLQKDKVVFYKKGEYYAPYFNMIDKLFNGRFCREADFSFIAECMLIKKDIMIELIGKIEENDKLEGESFYKKILAATRKNGLDGCYFSEYETYGNYVWRYYRGTCVVGKNRTLREAMKFFSGIPERYVLDYLSRDFDTVSFEKKHIQESPLGVLEFINKCLKG